MAQSFVDNTTTWFPEAWESKYISFCIESINFLAINLTVKCHQVSHTKLFCQGFTHGHFWPFPGDIKMQAFNILQVCQSTNKVSKPLRPHTPAHMKQSYTLAVEFFRTRVMNLCDAKLAYDLEFLEATILHQVLNIWRYTKHRRSFPVACFQPGGEAQKKAIKFPEPRILGSCFTFLSERLWRRQAAPSRAQNIRDIEVPEWAGKP